MPKTKFKFQAHVEITQGFYQGRTGIIVGHTFKWWPFGFHYAITGDPDPVVNQPSRGGLESFLFGGPQSSFRAVIAEGHLQPAKEKTLFADASGAVKEKTNLQ